MIKTSPFFFFLLFISCQKHDTANIYYLDKEDLLSIKDTTYVYDQKNLIGNFITKTVLKDSSLFIKELNNDQVHAYTVLDSMYNSFKYEKRPVKINDFAVSNENIFLLSSLSNKIIRFNKLGNYIDEIELKPDHYEVEHFMGESLFHYNAQKQIFYIGLKQKDKHTNGIETVGIFDSSGDLVSTFGDFSEDNSAGVRGFIISNEGMRSKFIDNKLYVLKKETSNLYSFNDEGKLINTQTLLFKKIPDKNKELKKGMSRGILKDQVMDFYVMDSAICYTYMTDTGDFFTQKKPENYLAFKKDESDTVVYTKIDFLKINTVDNNEIKTLSKDKNLDRYILLTLKLNY